MGLSYPLADIGIAAVLTRLALEVNRRDASLRLLGASLLCLLVADSGFAVTTAQNTYVNGQWSDSVTLVYYVLLAAAVLHPRAARTPTAARLRPGSRNRLLLAGVCGLSGPVIVLSADAGDTEMMHVGAWGTVVLLALVVLRGNRHLLRLQSTAAAMRHRAHHDVLTELPNRDWFGQLLTEVLAPSEERPAEVAILRVDLDGFRVVNDTAGYAAGDALLVATAERLRELAGVWPVGRIGADEFGVIIGGATAGGAVETLAEALLSSLREPFAVAGRALPMRASIGTAWAVAGDVTADELLSRGDVALATATAIGGGCVVAYDPRLAVAVLEVPALVAQLERALADDELEPVYQPLVALPSERITGFEALVRWRRHGRLIPPVEFLAAAHSSGLIVDIDRLVLRAAVRQLALWRSGDRDARSLAMSVNMSVRSLEGPGIVTEILDVLRDFDVPAGLLTVEVTEEAAAGAGAIRDRLDYLRRCGVRVALDDFGTGYSSLAYLEGFPADILKIAKPLVDPLTDPGAPTRVLSGVVQLARACEFEVLAEGVETREQRDRLVALGVERGQGYLFARPASADDAYIAWQASVTEGRRFRGSPGRMPALSVAASTGVTSGETVDTRTAANGAARARTS